MLRDDMGLLKKEMQGIHAEISDAVSVTSNIDSRFHLLESELRGLWKQVKTDEAARADNPVAAMPQFASTVSPATSLMQISIRLHMMPMPLMLHACMHDVTHHNLHMLCCLSRPSLHALRRPHQTKEQTKPIEWHGMTSSPRGPNINELLLQMHTRQMAHTVLGLTAGQLSTVLSAL